MKCKHIPFGLVGALILAAPGFAQHGPPSTPPQSQPPHGQPRGDMERDRTFDRDQDLDRMHDQDQDRDRMHDQDQDRDRMHDQDRLHHPDFSRLQDDDIYGRELLSAEERNAYRRQLQEAASAEERRRIEEQHREMVHQRAEERGVQLAPPGRGIYGGAMMSVEERARYREQLHMLDSDAARRQFMSEHRQSMQQRAQAEGVPLEDLDETGNED